MRSLHKISISKKIKIVFYVLLIITTSSCKEKKNRTLRDKQANVITNNISKEDGAFEIIIKAKILENDKFHIFYRDYNNNEFSSKRVVEALIQGQDTVQEVHFKIPEGIVPVFLRIDFGTNFEQKEIALEDIKLIYGSNSYVFDNERFSQMFRPNKYVEYDEKSEIIETRSLNGMYDPNFISINLEEVVFSLID